MELKLVAIACIMLCNTNLLLTGAASVVTPVAPPVSVPTTVITQPTACNLCDFLTGGNVSSLDNSLPITSGSTTTCADVGKILQDLNAPSCSLLQSSYLPIRCGCRTQAPSQAPISYPTCSVCSKEGELISNPYGAINLTQTSIDPNISSTFYNCQNIDYYASINDITPEVCSQLHQAGISELCGCHEFPVGPSSCATASALTLGETKYSSITNLTVNQSTTFKNNPCTIDSPSVWYRVDGTGGPLTIDLCGYALLIFNAKISIFTGAACDQLTCVGGNSNFDCKFTFLSKANQTYFVAVGGYYGQIGPFNLTLTDMTSPPTVTPSAYPSSSSTSAPTSRVTNFPSMAPVPTTTPTQYPTATVYPDCNVCGSPNKRMSLPNAYFGLSDGYPCWNVEYFGLTGQIEPGACSILSELNLAKTCGCVSPSGNDVCSGAILVSTGQTLNGTTNNATWDNEQICPFDNSYYSAGVWYELVGTGSPLKVDTCKFSDFYVSLSLFSGKDCSSLKCVASSSGFCGTGTRVTWNSTMGETYYALVRGTTPGNFELEVADVIPPANDQCSNAASILAGETVTGTVNDATPDGMPSCGDDRNNTLTPGVWYHFKSSGEPSRIVADTCGSGTTFDTAISVFTGSCGNLQCVAGNDNACYLSSRVEWESDTVTDYFILVHGPGTLSNSNDFQLALTVAVATPTVSPAPSYFYRPCNCGGRFDCFCFGSAPKTSTGGNSFPGSSFTKPAALPALPVPPPYSAPIVSPVSGASPSPIVSPISGTMPSPHYASSPASAPQAQHLSYAYTKPIYTSPKNKQKHSDRKNKLPNGNKKYSKSETKGGKDPASKQKV